jgi:hypothetical protein
MYSVYLSDMMCKLAANIKVTHHVDSVRGAQLQRLTLCLQHHIGHGADLVGQDVVGRVQIYPRFKLCLKGGIGPGRNW